ncbi:short-chain fatty acid transporter [Polyangium jinanense]|uniref:Short-chain fatty acid transporter n=1 Tax=Polyangium jinanense TaxID=2829994 RepID=A0A9X3XGF8_9BACT|nr:TIGR00366 family protein [Polyangium jinanense]MDC3958407.1 short-chain fatty acid transporter [Polyangium jinanense]MDC3988263.1 short-chain fatty acid transporter [Polyangium jinanense]
MSGAELPSSLDKPKAPLPSDDDPPAGALERVAARFTAWAERWIPDAFVFALVATFLVVIVAWVSLSQKRGAASAAAEVAAIWGGGFWELIPFTLQMALVIITGYVVATTRPVYRLIRALASVPRSPQVAIAWVALFAMLSSWLNWGFSLIFSAMLAKETARRVRGVDYRAVAASAFLGLGSIWAQGLSGSAALQMATPSAMQPATRAIVEAGGKVPGGVIPLSSTIFLWQSLVSVVVEIVIVTALVYLYAPSAARARSASDLGIDLGRSPLEADEPPRKATPGEWLEHSPIPSVLFVLLSGAYLVGYFASSGQGLNALNLNTVNLIFLTLGVLLHGTPARLMRAVKEATPGVWGVILQFPFYAGIAALIVKTHLNEAIAGFFVGLSTPRTYPAIVAVYSAVLGVFVPSGGSKWVIEAPYVMQAAHDLKVHLGWMVAVYDLGEALANLVQPFWMLPILGLFGLRARDVMGYTFIVFLVLLPIVLILVTVLGATLPYPL